MKIAITSIENNTESKIDTRFGRCSFFAIYNSSTETTEFVLNPNTNSDSGAGPASAQFIASLDVSVIYSGEFGGKAKSILDDFKIKTICVPSNEIKICEIIKTLPNEKDS